MHYHIDAKQAAYYRRRASECATAASAMAIAGVKEAYPNLEEGWLCLAPKFGERLDTLAHPKSECDSDQTANSIAAQKHIW
jgi:hypothetical protein